MSSTKNKTVEMNSLQRINHLVRRGAPVSEIVKMCRVVLNTALKVDDEVGAAGDVRTALWCDAANAMWAMATHMAALARENETLKRKLRPDLRLAPPGARARTAEERACGGNAGTMMNGSVLHIHSNHATPPPVVESNSENRYVGYFENCYGEQWVFTYDRTTHVATVTGGDVSWKFYTVEDGGIAPLVMHTEELLWLKACWHAATRSHMPTPKFT